MQIGASGGLGAAGPPQVSRGGQSHELTSGRARPLEETDRG
jgi:hypothetical protein